MARDVIHTALWVSDIDETVDFYVDGLGLAHNWEFTSDGVRNVYLGALTASSSSNTTPTVTKRRDRAVGLPTSLSASRAPTRPSRRSSNTANRLSSSVRQR